MSARDRRRRRTVWLASVVAHGAVALIPLSWLTLEVGGGESGGQDGARGTGFEVVLFAESTPGAAAPPVGTPTVPPPPEPEPPVLPEPEAPAVPVAPPPSEQAGEPDGTFDPAPDPGGGEGASGTAIRGLPGDDADGDEGPAGGGRPAPVFRPPRPLTAALPVSPEDVGDLDIPGEIPVRLRIAPDGRVIEIVPQMSDLPAPVMDALRESAEAMRFLPARRGGRRVEAWFSMRFVYRR